MLAQPRISEIEGRLATYGIQGGVHALVERWRAHVVAVERAVLTWERQFDPGLPPRQQASHGFGIFTLDATEVPDEWLLRHEWPGWGWREYGYGTANDLKSRALQLVRAGGPFGGPASIFRSAGPTLPCAASGMLRHASPAGEMRTGDFGPGLSVVLQVQLDGAFALRTLGPADRSHGEPVKPPAELGPVEALVLAQQRVPWTFTELWPLLGTIQTSAFNILACWLGADEVAIIAAKHEPFGILVGGWPEVRGLDVDRWLASLPDEPLVRAAVSPPPREVPPIVSTTQRPSWTSSDPPPMEGTAAGPRPVRGPALASPLRPPRVPRREVSSATALHRGDISTPAARAATERVEPLRGVQLPARLADALAAYFAVVEGELPARQTGAEFARELVWVLVRAAIAGTTTMTGAPAELLVTLHRQGHLRTLPSDQVGRDAFKILAVHTPLVRRIHYRRWCLAFGDLLDAESPLRAELQRYESA